MKPTSLLTTALLAMAATTVLLAQEVKLNIPAEGDAPAAVAAPAAPDLQFSEATLMETLGWFVMNRIGIAELQLAPTQVDSFIKGAALAANGKDSPHDLATVGPVMNKFIGARQDAALERASQKNIELAATFFASLKSRPGIIALPDGLCYEVLERGTGPYVKPTDTVKINYTGMLLDGQVFDSSEQHGQPLVIALDQAISGWSEGMQQINKGGKIKLYVPSTLAYGNEGAGPIPPSSALIFEIELLEILPVAKATE